MSSDGEASVSPVIGSVLMLSVTVLGITLVLFWGGPLLGEMQDRNAMADVLGDLRSARRAALDLEPASGAAHVPVDLPSGTLSLASDGRIMVTVNRQAGCDFEVTGWVSGAPAYSTAGCTGSVTQFEVDGAARTALVAATQPDPAKDYLFELAIAPPTSTVNAQAWLLRSDRLQWSSGPGGGGAVAALESGAIFTRRDGTENLAAAASIVEDETSGDLILRLPTLRGAGAVSGAGDHTLRLTLHSSLARVALGEGSVGGDTVRLDMHGDWARAWCGSLLLRNAFLTTDPYSEDGGDASAPCENPDPDDVYRVIYDTGATFSVHLSQARVEAGLFVG